MFQIIYVIIILKKTHMQVCSCYISFWESPLPWYRKVYLWNLAKDWFRRGTGAIM